MRRDVFEGFCSIAYNEAGISIKKGKESLVSSRVAKRVRALGLGSEQAYLEILQRAGSEHEMVRFLDAITTNFTNFMREPDHFQTLAELVPEGPLTNAGSFRIWCAAASTGEEPYSIAITIMEALNERKLDYKILATDISTRALKTAIAGCYDDKVVEPLSPKQRNKFFKKDEQRNFEVLPELRKSIKFTRLNLARPPFPMRGPLDVVFCRNVMIYFAKETRQALITEIERLLAPGATLFIGHSESLAGLDTCLRAVRPSVYLKPGVANTLQQGAA